MKNQDFTADVIDAYKTATGLTLLPYEGTDELIDKCFDENKSPTQTVSEIVTAKSREKAAFLASLPLGHDTYGRKL